MTARGIAERLVAKYGVRGAYWRAEHRRAKARLYFETHAGIPSVRRVGPLVLWQSVAAALAREEGVADA